MLTRYQMVRGARAASLPRGRRIDTRKHTRHVLRPAAAAVDAYLADPSDAAWATFRRQYLATLTARFRAERSAFDELAQLARAQDVYLGCSCPTTRNPDASRCHTVLALGFLRDAYPDLDVRFP